MAQSRALYLAAKATYSPRPAAPVRSTSVVSGSTVPLSTRVSGRLPIQTALDQVVHYVQDEPDQKEDPRTQEDGAFLLG